MTLHRYVLGRVVQGLVTVFLLTLIAHAAITVLPGDPVRALFGFRPPPPDLYQEIRERFHLDDPYWQQYLYYVRDLLHGDLGMALAGDPRGIVRTGQVADIVAGALPLSLALVGVGLTIQMIAGLLGGTLAALRRRGPAAITTIGAAVILVGLPVVLWAYVLRAFLGPSPVGVGWFPGWGMMGGWRTYVLPVAAMSANTVGSLVLLYRSELKASLQSPFARFARAAGVSGYRLVGVHAGKASLAPMLTFLSSNFGVIFTSLLIVEAVFGVPGIGFVIFQAVRSRDRSLVIGATLVVALVVVLANLIADVLAAAVDPRLRTGEQP